MKKLIAAILTLSILICYSCNNTKKETDSIEGVLGKDDQKSQSALSDSLEKEVMDGHDVGMAKYGKLKSLKFAAEQMADSIAKLPAAAKQAAAPLKAKLEQLILDLSNARESMDTWMREFDMDSAINNPEKRIQYLQGEKAKVNKVKQMILISISAADSLIKK
jgi:hypothetical protein